MIFASYGQASAPRSQGFAEAATLSVARDFPLGSDFSWGVELTPLFVVNQTRVDLPGRPREVAYAVAVAPVLAWTHPPKASRFGLRLEGGVGIFWGVLADSRRGLAVQLPRRVRRLSSSSGPEAIASSRPASGASHVSNLGLAGSDNPGLSFYSGVVGLSWSAR